MTRAHQALETDYIYITVQFMTGNVSRVIYKQTEVMERNYFIQVLKGKLFYTNKMGLMNGCFTKSIKIKVGEIASIVSPVHDKYIYIYIYIYK